MRDFAVASEPMQTRRETASYAPPNNIGTKPHRWNTMFAVRALSNINPDAALAARGRLPELQEVKRKDSSGAEPRLGLIWVLKEGIADVTEEMHATPIGRRALGHVESHRIAVAM